MAGVAVQLAEHRGVVERDVRQRGRVVDVRQIAHTAVDTGRRRGSGCDD